VSRNYGEARHPADTPDWVRMVYAGVVGGLVGGVIIWFYRPSFG
jgi:hypothetical protein